jgi:hypothetical protein
MSRAQATVAAARREIAADREGDRKWLLSILLGAKGGLTLARLHTKCVLDHPSWTRDHVSRLCQELAEAGRAHKDGDRWFHGKGSQPYMGPSAAPKVEPPRPPAVVRPGPPEPLPPRGALRAPPTPMSEHPGATAGHLSGAQQGGSPEPASITAEVPASSAQTEAETVAEDLAPCSSAAAEMVTGGDLETVPAPSGNPEVEHVTASQEEAAAEFPASSPARGVDDEAALYPSQTAPTAPWTGAEAPALRPPVVAPGPDAADGPQILVGGLATPCRGDEGEGCPPAPVPAVESGGVTGPETEEALGWLAAPTSEPVSPLPAPLAPEVESVRWESPPGVPEEPSSRLSPSAEPSSGGGADGGRAAVSAGVAGQPAGASAGVGALVGAGPSRPGPSGDRQPEHGADPAPPASPSCPPSPVPVSVVDERAPAPVPGVGAEPEGDGFGTELRTARQAFLQALDREEERLHELQLRVVELEQRLAQVESLEQRAAELEAENARLRAKVEHVLGFLGAP